MNLSSSIVYDVLKEFVSNGYDISKLLDGRAIGIDAVTGFVGEIRLLAEHVRIFMHLHRAKQDVRRAEEIRAAVQAVLTRQPLKIDSTEVNTAIDLFMKNLVPAIRGVIIEELRKKDVLVDTKAEGVIFRGIPLSHGFGYGRPIRWERRRLHLKLQPYVLVLSNSDVAASVKPQPLFDEAAAILTWDGGVTSHVAVASRSMGRPAVLITSSQIDLLMRRELVYVDGSSGEIRSYHQKPEVVLPTPAPKKRKKSSPQTNRRRKHKR